MDKGAYAGICMWFVGGFAVATFGIDPGVQHGMAFWGVLGGLITDMFSR